MVGKRHDGTGRVDLRRSATRAGSIAPRLASGFGRARRGQQRHPETSGHLAQGVARGTVSTARCTNIQTHGVMLIRPATAGCAPARAAFCERAHGLLSGCGAHPARCAPRPRGCAYVVSFYALWGADFHKTLAPSARDAGRGAAKRSRTLSATGVRSTQPRFSRKRAPGRPARLDRQAHQPIALELGGPWFFLGEDPDGSALPMDERAGAPLRQLARPHPACPTVADRTHPGGWMPRRLHFPINN